MVDAVDQDEAARLKIHWVPPGPVANKFMNSTAPVQCIQGPVGSGKTGTCFLKIIKLAGLQKPGPDGVARFKCTIVRDTYRQLWKSTIETWNDWVPKTKGDWTGGQNEPATHTLLVNNKVTGGLQEMIVKFVAIGDGVAEDVLRGYDTTMFFLNEADLLDEAVFQYVLTRHGRYPLMRDGGPTWHGVIMDCNAPDTESWLYKKFIEDKPEKWEYFRQPSGLSPQAENLKNLVPGYYTAMAENLDAWMVRKLVENEFTFSRDGKPVFPEFNDLLHCAAEPLKPFKNLPLIIGLDAGGSPAASIWQRLPNGQWRGLDEVVCLDAEVMGPTRFAELLNQMLAEKYRDYESVAWADPSAAYGADQNSDEQSWIEIVANKTKISIRPAPSNSITPRLEAVRSTLVKMIDGRIPGMIISPTMVVFRKGFAATYHFKRIAGSNGRFREVPDKNAASNVHDSAQYALLGGGDHGDIMGRGARLDNAPRQITAISDECPDGEWTGGSRDNYGFDQAKEAY